MRRAAPVARRRLSHPRPIIQNPSRTHTRALSDMQVHPPARAYRSRIVVAEGRMSGVACAGSSRQTNAFTRYSSGARKCASLYPSIYLICVTRTTFSTCNVHARTIFCHSARTFCAFRRTYDELSTHFIDHRTRFRSRSIAPMFAHRLAFASIIDGVLIIRCTDFLFQISRGLGFSVYVFLR